MKALTSITLPAWCGLLRRVPCLLPHSCGEAKGKQAAHLTASQGWQQPQRPRWETRGKAGCFRFNASAESLPGRLLERVPSHDSGAWHPHH